MSNKNTEKVEATDTPREETAEEKVARLERELKAQQQQAQGYKALEDCTQEELIAEIRRLHSSNTALKKLINNFIEKL